MITDDLSDASTDEALADMPVVVSVAAGTDHSFAITADGKAYSWGFSSGGRTGQGTEDDIEVPTLVRSKSLRNRRVTFAAAGGPFSILAGPAEGERFVNGNTA